MITLEMLAEFPLAQRIGWSLMHFVWQGAGLSLLLMLALTALRNRSPQSRYLVCYGALLAMALAPVITACCLTLESVASDSAIPVATQFQSQPKYASTPPISPLNHIEAPVAHFSPATAPAVRPEAPMTFQGLLNLCKRKSAPVVPWLLLFWFCGVFLISLHNVAGWLLVQRLRRTLVEPISQDWAPLLAELQARLGVARSVALLKSGIAQAPATIGWMKPVILVPASMLTGLSREELTAILAHEFAHIRRHDYMFNLVQVLIETLLFYHPVVWWVSRRIRMERELCCDDLAVMVCGDRLGYARALTRIEELRQRSSRFALAATGGDLLMRIRRLAGVKAPGEARPLSGFIGLVLVFLFTLGLGWTELGRAYAQNQQSPPPERTIVLPETWSMGQILIRPWGDTGYQIPWGEGLNEGWTPLAPAQGNVVIPEGQQVRLVLDNNAVTDLSPLDYLGPDDIQSIDFRQTEIRDGDLQHLQGMALRELTFENTEISDSALEYVADMSSLEYLSVGRTQVTDGGMQYLAGLNNLRYLDLNLTGVSDESMQYLQNMTELEYLDLWMGHFGDEGLQYVANMPNMRILGLEGTFITDAGLQALQNLHQLQGLNLEVTSVGDAGLAYLRGLEGLRELYLFNTQVSAEGLDVLRALSGLNTIRLPETIDPESVTALQSGNGLQINYPAAGAAHSFEVLSARDRSPVPGAFVDFQYAPELNVQTRYYWTDARGAVTFYSKRTGDKAALTVHADGYLSKTVDWILNPSDKLVIELEKSLKIGGSVTNAQGAAVAGVQVALPIPGKRSFKKGGLLEHTEVTGESGVWECVHGPSDLAQLSLVLRHPGYADTPYAAGSLSTARLINGTQTLVIDKGIELTGLVADEAGQPVPGAVVSQLEARQRENVLTATNRKATTGKDGLFRFDHCVAQPYDLKADAPGYVAVITKVQAAQDMAPVTIVLPVGRLLRGRVIDQRNQPLAGVTVATIDREPLITPDATAIKLRTSTDAQGRFTWDEAPKGPVELSFQKEGRRGLTKSLEATDEEHIIVLNDNVIVTGTVIDGITGEPVESFRVRAADDSGNMQIDGVATLNRGVYVMNMREFDTGFSITIEAEGYLTARSAELHPREASTICDFRLKRAPRIQGVLLTPDGAQAAGAAYALALPEYHIAIRNGALDVRDKDRIKVTNADGAYAFDGRESPYLFIATHDSGFALADAKYFEEHADVVLTPWARVEGVVRIAEAPASNAIITLFPMRSGVRGEPQYNFSSETVSNAEGRFTFDRVLPEVSRLERIHPDSPGDSRIRAISIGVLPVAGETLTAQLGGSGRPVTGTMLLPPDLKARVVLKQCSRGNLSKGAEMPWPKDFDSWIQAAREKWIKDWPKSDAGKKRELERYLYGFYLDEAAGFRIDDVVAGHYTLYVELFERVEGTQAWELPVIAHAEFEFDVPEMEGERTSDVLELGGIPVRVPGQK